MLALLALVNAAIIPANPITTTYVGGSVPVATSYQVVSRNDNHVLVPPTVPVVPTTALTYPGYTRRWVGYPSYGHPSYGYHYGYGYGYPHLYTSRYPYVYTTPYF